MTFRVNPGNSQNTCHILPCKINYDGAVDTTNFAVSGSQASFRGRPLVGRTVDLHGYTGVVLEPDTHRVARKFDTLTVWGHGVADQDTADRLQELLTVSRALSKTS
ncbi:hypothetical protein B9G98_01199 [Wickerhamiella sorbophila]|uniref:Uncharacterized protein n=1 Tax=Wickerhamiella sorbophila TaxID=45607 RepID=A0A2T0FF34_9ASCO|nr:hypothetical protein B9G98_01199 [Wickerhamiella sorbophila]PRT53579.1 hypothetical protein B9G98_01199 [Wickerhamiella sorbophila]